SASAPPAVDGSRHTEPLSPEDVAAAAALAAAGDSGPSDPAPSPAAPSAGLSVLGLVAAIVGIAVGVAGLLALPWATGPGPDLSYLDLRDLVDASGPDIAAVANAFVLTGALFAVGAGGVVALARAIGATPLRVVAGIVVVLGVAGLAVLGFASIDVDQPLTGATDTVGVGPDAGAPVTLPDGTPVTDPSTGDPVTVSEGDAGAGALTDEQLAGVAVVQGEDRLTDAAVVGAGALVATGLLLLVGLVLRGTAGRIVAAVGLLALAGWAGATVVTLRDQAGLGDLANVGLGPYALVASAVVLAVSAALPGRKRPRPAA
ncbi:MAG TPA: hypothetical protein VF228_11160, partial [Iamia sp.]